MAMTRFERMAVITIIENMSQQLQGLKILISSSTDDSVPQHRTTQVPMPKNASTQYTDEDEDKRIDAAFDPQAETDRLTKEAEAETARMWKEAMNMRARVAAEIAKAAPDDQLQG